MLVLTRHVEESIIIADDILVTILGVDRGVVRVGIEAPKEIRVDRMEIRARINAERDGRIAARPGATPPGPAPPAA